ncbi:MAG: hypothetical protein PHC92_10630 [Syntrophomonadaceae bacterium]|nr:hypothetical protein [Syntrophomonadaceae bacterium]MDD3023246.1 hypothetical protein [Syntrophomonadaceae bacterium]
MEIQKFSMQFLKQEKHLLLPNISSIILVQNLYDILFQYAISEEKEQKLKNFINIMETHIKSKSRAPFSLPVTELEFLEEGLEELKLLNWMEIPVAKFELQVSKGGGDPEEELLTVLDYLDSIITYKREKDSHYIYIYPNSLTVY